MKKLNEETEMILDQLAENLVMDNVAGTCEMCARGENCNQQVSGLVCRNGVKQWLISMAQRALTKTEIWSIMTEAEKASEQEYPFTKTFAQLSDEEIDDIIRTAEKMPSFYPLIAAIAKVIGKKGS